MATILTLLIIIDIKSVSEGEHVYDLLSLRGGKPKAVALSLLKRQAVYWLLAGDRSQRKETALILDQEV